MVSSTSTPKSLAAFLISSSVFPRMSNPCIFLIASAMSDSWIRCPKINFLSAKSSLGSPVHPGWHSTPKALHKIPSSNGSLCRLHKFPWQWTRGCGCVRSFVAEIFRNSYTHRSLPLWVASNTIRLLCACTMECPMHCGGSQRTCCGTAGMGCNTGVSTSKYPRSLKKLRMALKSRVRLRKISYVRVHRKSA